MTSPLTERLRLEVDADTSKGENAFDRLGSAADDTAKRAKASGDEVTAAADRVAAARLKEQDASGKLSVAETRLQEVRGKYAANSSQVAAAEERVEAAQRRVQAAAGATTRAVEDQTRVQSAAAQSAGQHADASARVAAESDRAGRGTRFFADQLRSLGSLGGAVAGFAIGAAIRESVTAYTDGARAAGQFAIATNSSTGEASRLLGVVGSLGLDFNDLLEIQAEFAQKSDSLADIGVTLQRNADGTVNWTSTLEDTLGALQDIPDATERNAAGFRFFGEEGYKQLSRLVNTGQDVSEVFEAVGTPFDDDDVEAAARYDAALREASLAGGDLQRSLGGALLPLVTGLATGLDTVVDIATGLPLPLVAATTAAVALGITGFSPAAVAAGRLEVITAAVTRQLALYSAAAATGGASSAILSTGMAAAAGTGRALLGFVGGPLGAAVIGLAGVYTVAKSDMDSFTDSTQRAARESLTAEQAYGDQAASVQELAERLYDSADAGERFAASARGFADAAEQGGGIDGLLSDLGFNNALLGGFSGQEFAVRGYTNAVDEAKNELGAFAAQQETAQTTAKTLNDLIAEGTTGGSEFATAVQAAAEAQATQAATSGLAEAAVAAYTATTTGAVDATLGLIGAQLGVRDAEFAFLGAIDAANSAVDDQATLVDEVAQAGSRVTTSALSLSAAAADAAVAAATANGTVLTGLAEAQIRADATIGELQNRLNTPGLGDAARAEIQGIIDQLVAAKDNGTIEATLQTLGVGEATSEIDTATEDRDTTVTVESRNGPAVISYLDGIAAATRLALVMVESRGGPAVFAYLASIVTAARLALIQVESRNGPATDAYIDSIAAQSRLAIINVESRGGPAVESYLDQLARTRTATIQVRQQAVGAPVTPGAGPTGASALRGAPVLTGVGGGTVLSSVSLDLQLTGQVDRGQLSSADRGRANIRDIQAAERQGGSGWRKRT